jgi:hypothetical protein
MMARSSRSGRWFPGSYSGPAAPPEAGDARWTVKTTKAKPREGGTPLVDLAIPAFGYQNHISADRRHRLIRRWLVTDAAAHAGARLADLLDPVTLPTRFGPTPATAPRRKRSSCASGCS